MGINLVSEATCREAYIDYYYRGRSANYDPKDIAAIKDKWGSELKSWDALGTREVDTTQYELTDDEVSDARKNGEETAREATGDYKKGGDIVNTTTKAAVLAAATTCTIVAALNTAIGVSSTTGAIALDGIGIAAVIYTLQLLLYIGPQDLTKKAQKLVNKWK